MGITAVIFIVVLCLIAISITLFMARTHEASVEASHPPEGRFIEIDGRRVHVVVRGAGPNLVLIHGASGNTRDFTFSLVARLEKDFRVLVFDRPGLGYTDDIGTTGATLAQQAELLQKAAQSLGAPRPIVLGHSYGGGVTLAWAIHHPDNLSALVLLSSPSNLWTTPLDPLYRLTSHPVLGPIIIPLLTAFVPDARVKSAIEGVFHPQSAPAGYASYIGAGLTLRRSSMRANGLQRANLQEEITGLIPYYGEISVPTEILHGTADTIVSTKIHSDLLVNQIKGAVLTRLDGIGHTPHHVAQDAVIDTIMRAARRARLH